MGIYDPEDTTGSQFGKLVRTSKQILNGTIYNDIITYRLDSISDILALDDVTTLDTQDQDYYFGNNNDDREGDFYLGFGWIEGE